MFRSLKKIGVVLFCGAILLIALDGVQAAYLIHDMIFNFFHLVSIVFTGHTNLPIPTISTK